MAIRVSFREYRASNGETTLFARFKIPERKDGKIVERYVERSTSTSQRVKARQRAEEIYQEAYEQAYKKPEDEIDPDTFAAAALAYMKHNGGKTTPIDGLIPAARLKVRANKRYLFHIIGKIGLKKLSEINQALVGQIADQIYPGRTAATINRQLYTPIIAVMNHAKHPVELERPAGYDSLPELDVPPDSWYAPVLREANPYARAFLITQRMTGRRPDELLNRTRDHFSDEMGTLLFWDGKGEQFIMLQLPEPALIAIRALPDLRESKKGSPTERLTHSKRNFLFGTNHASTMRAWLKDACKAAGVRYHMPKEAGRHAFVTKNLEEGRSLKWVQDSGRWKTLKIVAEKYSHLEKQEIDRQARQAGEDWFRKMLNQPIQIEQRVSGKSLGKDQKS
jgi:hypothetical protein